MTLFAKIQRGFWEDVPAHVRQGGFFDRMITSVFDDEAWTEEHATLIQGLKKAGVVVVSRPAKIRPSAATSSAKGKKR